MDSAAIRHITVIGGPMDDCWRDYDPAFTERAKRTVAKIPSCPACDCIGETAARDAGLGSRSSDPRYKSRHVLGKIRRKKSPRFEGSVEGLKMILI